MHDLPRHLLPPHARARNVTAVLGPTNTGKTHYAIERMLAYGSGIIGLPLRLLAREVYGKIVARVGPDKVALVTGEEKIKPDQPRYWVATVEAMPRDLTVDFVAIDEVQLAADLERGHVFTDRLLHHRGLHETLLLGAGTMRGIVQALMPGVNMVARPRLSKLSYSGPKKITRLPPRSAAVAFAAHEVYAIAELIRRHRGGAAVVLGALSPRTRNAQVALYQSGDVDFIVATDAIGMGLNLDVEHVAFASDRKFDGYQFRNLNAGEMGQIAGRAGRHLNDGTFGVTGGVEPLEADMVERLENHEFEPVRLLQWRNPALDLRTLDGLRASLALPPRESGLARAPVAEDIEVVEIAARDDEIRELCAAPGAVARLWEAAQVPDYRKVSPASHADLCLDIFRFLEKRGKLPTDWFARQVAQSDRTDGDIDTLSTRIAHMRTWTFVANRPDWLDDPEHWRETTRALEDRLSDALHERLMQRFVDRRTSVLLRRLRENAAMEAQINEAGDVLVEGQPVGRLQGFQFTPDATAEAQHGKALRAAAAKALAGAIQARAEKVSEAGNETFVLASNGGLRWMGEEIARLSAGDSELEPRIRLLADDGLGPLHRERVQARVEAWLRHHVGTLLKPLFDLRAGTGLEGLARGIAFRLVEDLGVIERSKVAEDLKTLDQPARAALRQIGVRFGAHHLFVPAIMKPKPRELAAQLWALKHGGLTPDVLQELPQLAQSGRTSFPAKKELPKGIYRVLGYKVLGERAVRVDILERLADLIRPLVAYRPGVSTGMPPKGAADGDGFTATVEMTSLVGCSGADFGSILRALGYRSETKPAADLEAVLEAARASAAAASTARVAPAAPAAEATAADTAASETSEAEAAPSADEAGSAVDAAAGADAEPAVTEAAPEAEPETPPTSAPDIAIADTTPPVAPAAEDPVSEPESATPVAIEAAAESADAAPPEPAAPILVEIWRPARYERHPPRQAERQRGRRGPPPAAAAEGETAAPRRPRRPNRWQPGTPTSAPADAPAATDAASPTPAPGDTGQRQGRPDRRPDRKPERRPERRPDRPAREAGGPGERPPRPEGERPRGPRPDRDRDRNPDRAPRVFSSEDRRRGSEPDPDSPFAKLAALKARMEADKKS